MMPFEHQEPTRYVVGFAHDHQLVALIEKRRPDCQAGRLNGIGGHVEPGEQPGDAMRREFHEETGTKINAWSHMVSMTFPGAVIDFYESKVHTDTLRALRTTTDEPVRLIRAAGLDRHRIVPNLAWLVPLAMYEADRYRTIRVAASVAEVIS